MTLPDERTRAVLYTQSFLIRLLSPKATPKVPKKIRMEALRLLRHYPHGYELDYASRHLPSVFGRVNDKS